LLQGAAGNAHSMAAVSTMVDNSSNLGKFWKGKIDDVIRGDNDPDGQALMKGGKKGSELQESFNAVMAEPEVRVADSTRPRMDEVPEAIQRQRTAVKGTAARRVDAGKPCEPFGKGNVKKSTPFDDSKLLKMEADMAKKFSDKVAGPTANIRPSRVKELKAASVTDFCRGNELYDKRDYEASLAEYEAAAQVAPLRLFALINRGNAYKALGMPAEAAACYQDALDEAKLDSQDGRIIHSYATNNLGAAAHDEGKLEQAMQHLGSAVALNARCYLAIRNRANLHMHLAHNLHTADNPALLPPQHELAHGLYGKAMEEDWHLPIAFRAGKVLIRAEQRITSRREDPDAAVLRNSCYHFTSNLTHATSSHV
jgi:tetratricopeptide (TPR) repeat protein